MCIRDRGNGKYAKKGNFLCYRTSSAAIFKGLVSAGAIDSDKFTGKMADSIYYNSGKYYNLSGSLFTSLVSGDKKGTVVTVSYTHLDVYKRQDMMLLRR